MQEQTDNYTLGSMLPRYSNALATSRFKLETDGAKNTPKPNVPNYLATLELPEIAKPEILTYNAVMSGLKEANPGLHATVLEVADFLKYAPANAKVEAANIHTTDRCLLFAKMNGKGLLLKQPTGEPKTIDKRLLEHALGILSTLAATKQLTPPIRCNFGEHVPLSPDAIAGLAGLNKQVYGTRNPKDVSTIVQTALLSEEFQISKTSNQDHKFVPTLQTADLKITHMDASAMRKFHKVHLDGRLPPIEESLMLETQNKTICVSASGYVFDLRRGFTEGKKEMVPVSKLSPTLLPNFNKTARLLTALPTEVEVAV